MSLEIALGYIEESGTEKSCEVMGMLSKVGAGKSGEAALQMVMDHIDTGISGLAKACLLLAMSPFVTFGVGAETVPAVGDEVGDDGSSWDAGTVELLKDLALRNLTGHNARDAIVGEMARLAWPSRSLLYRVLVKEMRLGAGPKTVNKFHKGLIPIFEHKGAKRTKEALHKVVWPCYAEYKLDGFRCVVKTNGVTAETFSRNGLPMTNLEPRAEHLRQLTAELIGDGLIENRMWAWDGEGKAPGHFNATSSEARKAGKGEELVYHIFDMIPWEHMSGGTEPIETRHKRLDMVQRHLILSEKNGFGGYPKLKVIDRFELDEEADAWELYAMARELGHEGLILKQKGSLYIPGKNNDWVKVKPEETKDLVVTGTYPGEKGSKYEGLIGGLIVDHEGVPVKVGSGLSDDDRARDPSYFLNRVAEIMYHEVTPDGSLREPRLKTLRDDKHPEDADGADSAEE